MNRGRSRENRSLRPSPTRNPSLSRRTYTLSRKISVSGRPSAAKNASVSPPPLPPGAGIVLDVVEIVGEDEEFVAPAAAEVVVAVVVEDWGSILFVVVVEVVVVRDDCECDGVGVTFSSRDASNVLAIRSASGTSSISSRSKHEILTSATDDELGSTGSRDDADASDGAVMAVAMAPNKSQTIYLPPWSCCALRRREGGRERGRVGTWSSFDRDRVMGSNGTIILGPRVFSWLVVATSLREVIASGGSDCVRGHVVGACPNTVLSRREEWLGEVLKWVAVPVYQSARIGRYVTTY